MGASADHCRERGPISKSQDVAPRPGLVCAGTSFAAPNALPLSCAAALWPMPTTMISADRGDAYSRRGLSIQ